MVLRESPRGVLAVIKGISIQPQLSDHVNEMLEHYGKSVGYGCGRERLHKLRLNSRPQPWKATSVAYS